MIIQKPDQDLLNFLQFEIEHTEYVVQNYLKWHVFLTLAHIFTLESTDDTIFEDMKWPSSSEFTLTPPFTTNNKNVPWTKWLPFWRQHFHFKCIFWIFFSCGIDSNLIKISFSGLIDDMKSELFQVMAWHCQATRNYLDQCQPKSQMAYDDNGMLYGITEPQWVK